MQRMRQEAGIALPEQPGELGHRRRRRRRRRRRDDVEGPREGGVDAANDDNEKLGVDSNFNTDEIDLESGLAFTNGVVR